eukprot:5581567-Prymnesium_polylepis.1
MKPTGLLWARVRQYVLTRGIFWFWYGMYQKTLHAEGGWRRTRDQASFEAGEGGIVSKRGPVADPGVSEAFQGMNFTLCVEFEPLEDWKIAMLLSSGEYREFTDDEGLDADGSLKQHMERYWNGAIPKAWLSPVERFDEDKDEFVELKGAELDAIAFHGPEITFYLHDDPLRRDGRKTFKAPSGDCFTISELHSVLDEFVKANVLYQQVCVKNFNLDHVFYEGLYNTEDGSYAISWGS